MSLQIIYKIALLGLFILMPLGGEIGKRKAAKSELAT
jgi:hypothetical protein